LYFCIFEVIFVLLKVVNIFNSDKVRRPVKTKSVSINNNIYGRNNQNNKTSPFCFFTQVNAWLQISNVPLILHPKQLVLLWFWLQDS